MSDIFAFDPTATAPLLEAAKANSVDSLEELQARPWQGLGAGIGSGFMRGGAKVGQAVGMAGGALLSGVEFGTGYPQGSLTDAYFKGLDESVNSAVDYWTPRPQEVGKAGQILGGLSEVALPLMAGGGNPTLLIGSQELGQATDLARQGVEARTAVEAGLITGVSTAAGLKIPILGKTLSSRLASGAAGNLAFGAASREAEKTLLTARGYADQAPNVLDLASISADALTGLLFGGLHHSLAPKIDPKLTPSQVDAVLTARNAKSFQSETAPGVPQDISSSVGHQEALETALEQLSRSEPVDVSEAVTKYPASFTPDGRLEESVRTAREVQAGQPTDVPYDPHSVTSDTPPEGDGYHVQEGELTDAQRQAFQGLRSDLPPDQVVPGSGAGEPGQSGAVPDGLPGKDPLTVFRGGRGGPLTSEHFEPETLGTATGHPSSGLGVYFTNAEDDAAQYGQVTAHHLDIRNPKVVPVDELPGFDTLTEATAYREKLKAQGHDGIVIDASHLGGPVHYVAFDPHQVIPARPVPERSTPETPVSTLNLSDALKAKPEAASALPEVAALQSLAHERPTATVYTGTDADGNPVRSTLADEADRIQAEYDQRVKDAQAYQVAINCFLGHGA